jgi:MFS family permease
VAGYTLFGFTLIFSIAMLARWVSVYHLAKMVDPPGHVAAIEIPIGHQWLQRIRQSQFVRFSLFFALMQFSVAIASPFFAVYMLRDLDYSYSQFMANAGMSVLAQFLTLTQWGRISDVFGNRRVLSVTGVLLPLMPLLWIVSHNFWYLLAVQALSGLAWAGFTLSAGNFLYDLIARERRATYLAIHNILAGSGIFCGAMLGGFLGVSLPATLEFMAISWAWMSPLLGVFAISALARMTVILLLLPKIREVRRVRNISFSNVIFRVTRVRALAGIMFDIVGSKPESADKPKNKDPE